MSSCSCRRFQRDAVVSRVSFAGVMVVRLFRCEEGRATPKPRGYAVAELV